jgi:putative nucleotidyltransferase with HDIG domain
MTARLTLDALGAGARELLQALDVALGPGRPAWLVGGAVRDALSGAIVRDLDLAVPSGAIALARELAGRLDAAFVVLDEKRGAARLTGAGGYAWRGPQVDVADFRAPDLAGDLRGRDFTVNALAVMLPERDAMKETTQSEPHRFDVWEHSLRAVEGADLLAGRARELEPWGDAFAAHLDEVLGDGASRREALKLAALLHDIAKPETRSVEDGRTRFLGHDVRGAERVAEIAARWRLSGRLTGTLERLVRQHLRPMHLAMAGEVTRRARYRFFRDLGDEALDVLLLALADSAALRGDSPLSIWEGEGGRVVRELMAGHADEARAITAPPLLDGREVMQTLGLGPGPELGRLLALLREAQAVGAVSTREAAVAYLRQLRPGNLDTPEAVP